MILFDVHLENETIHEAASLVTRYSGEAAFLMEVGIHSSFNHTKDSGIKVADKIAYASLKIAIKPYKTWNPWSKVIGYAKNNTIYVNTRKLDLSLQDRVENLFHEALHLLGYSHDGNYVTEYNLKTVPYQVSNIFAKYVMKVKTK